MRQFGTPGVSRCFPFHGRRLKYDTTAQIEELTDVYSFLLWQLGGAVVRRQALVVGHSSGRESSLPPFAKNAKSGAPFRAGSKPFRQSVISCLEMGDFERSITLIGHKG
jgi:hypothetical protein